MGWSNLFVINTERWSVTDWRSWWSDSCALTSWCAETKKVIDNLCIFIHISFNLDVHIYILLSNRLSNRMQLWYINYVIPEFVSDKNIIIGKFLLFRQDSKKDFYETIFYYMKVLQNCDHVFTYRVDPADGRYIFTYLN